MRHRLNRVLALAALVALPTLTACGDDTVTSDDTLAPITTTAPPHVVLTYATTGGCLVLGPNCATYDVWSDGRVDISRTGEPGGPVITGTVPVADVTAWLAGAQRVDPAALVATVGTGTCNSCVDGIDITVTIRGDGSPIVLDSTVVAFDTGHPFFADLERLMAQVRTVGELSMVEHS